MQDLKIFYLNLDDKVIICMIIMDKLVVKDKKIIRNIVFIVCKY